MIYFANKQMRHMVVAKILSKNYTMSSAHKICAAIDTPLLPHQI